MDEELKKRILSDLKATGFPTELKIAEILKANKWDVAQNSTYLDYEANKSREIDIVARKVFDYSENGKLCVFFAINLVIEAKKFTKRPWVIFTKPNNEKAYSSFLGPAYGQLWHARNFTTKALSPEALMQEFPRNKEDSLGISFYEAFKSPDEPSKIYEAIISAIKASVYVRRQETGEDYLIEKENKEKQKEPFKPNEIQSLEVYMPVVVVDGVLCQAIMAQNDEIELKETMYIPVVISHSIKPYDENYGYFPEIVHIKYLLSFISSLSAWGNSVLQLWKKNN